MQFAFCMYISMEALVKSRNICWVWSGMPGHVQVLQKDKATISLERAYFAYFLHVVSQPCKLQSYYVILVGYRPACSKFSKATNQQYLRKGSLDFVHFLQVVIWILLDIHWSHKNGYFGLALSDIGSHPIRLLNALNLKNSQRIWGIKMIYFFHWN